MRVLLVAMALAGACGKDAAECERRAGRLGERLVAAAETGGPMYVPPGLTPIESTRGAPLSGGGPVLVVDERGGLDLDGRPVATIAELRERLAMDVDKQPGTRPIYLLVDADLPAATLGALLAVVPAVREPRLVVSGALPTPEPGDRERAERPAVKRLLAETEAAGPSDKAVTLARHMEKAIGRCKALEQAFGEVAADHEDKAKFLAPRVAPALRRCECEVADLDVIEYALLAVFGVADRPQRWVPVPPIELDDARRARELVPR